MGVRCWVAGPALSLGWALELSLVLDPEEGALLEEALAAALEEGPEGHPEAHPEGRPEEVLAVAPAG